MYVSKRIIYNSESGTILNASLDDRFDSGIDEQLLDDIRPSKIDFVDIEHGPIDATKYRIVKIDVVTKQPILEEIVQELTPEQQQIKDLEDQLLIAADNEVGGIL